MCNVQYYDVLIDFIGHYLKRDRHKYTEWGWKKNDINLYLDIFSFMVDIRPGSEYPSDEEINFLVIIYIIIIIIIIIVVVIIIIIIIVIIIINIDSGSIYKYNGSSPYKLEKIWIKG